MDEQRAVVMACPVCRTGLMMSERQGIEIDYCPTCRGVWLDRGELDKIIERSASSPPPPQPQMNQAPGTRANDRYSDRHYGHHKRKKSFFEELFD